MPVSAYLQAAAFVIRLAVALFASAGTISIATFWVYIAIFVASFAGLDPDLLRERMRPGGPKPPVALRLFSVVLFVDWIIAGFDRGRLRWSDTVPGWLQWLGLAAMGGRLCAVLLGVAREPVLLLGDPHPDRPRAACGHNRSLRRGPASGLHRRHLIIVASRVALDSWLAAAFLIVVSSPFLLYRAIREDRILQVELQGYRDYPASVR